MKIISVYIVLTLATLGWWYAAFHGLNIESSSQNTFISQIDPIEHAHWDSLSPLDRKELQKALSGDYVLMGKLIQDWDIDAQLLHHYSVQGINRLNSSEFVRSQEIVRKLQKARTNGSSIKLLPQTFVAASFLMALVPPTQIVAIPKGMRNQTQIYSKSVMDQVPLDIDRYHTESLYLALPDIAFAAHYSDPATVQTLKDQGIKLIFLSNIATLKDVKDALLTIGKLRKSLPRLSSWPSLLKLLF